jgi:hypothetical protein
MPGGAGQLSSGGGQGRGAGAVTAEPSRGWPRVPRRRDPGEVGPPSGCRRSEDVRTPASPSLPCPRPRSGRGDVRPTGRADIRCSCVRCPGVRCPGVRGRRVSGRTGRRCPRHHRRAVRRWTPEWLGVAGRAQRVDVPPWSAAAWSPAGIGPNRKAIVRRWPWLARMRVDRSPGPPLGRRPGCGAAWPAGRHGRWSRARVPAGWGSPGRSRCSSVPPQGVWAVTGVVPDHGLGPGGGDHAAWSVGEGGPVASSSGGPTRFGGGAACGRSAAAAHEERCPPGADSALTC